jgi:hypothetical protein
MSQYIDVDALWRVTLLSLGFGAGVVALYALGVVAFARGATTAANRAGALAAGALCLLVCLGAVALGIWVMLDK